MFLQPEPCGGQSKWCKWQWSSSKVFISIFWKCTEFKMKALQLLFRNLDSDCLIFESRCLSLQVYSFTCNMTIILQIWPPTQFKWSSSSSPLSLKCDQIRKWQPGEGGSHHWHLLWALPQVHLQVKHLFSFLPLWIIQNLITISSLDLTFTQHVTASGFTSRWKLL